MLRTRTAYAYSWTVRPAELTLEALDDQRWLYAALTLETSAVLRRAVSEDGLNPWEYFRDGEYPAARAEKDEIERLVERLLATVDQDTLAVLWEEQRDWLQAQAGRAVDDPKERERRLAFWMLHLALEQARDRRRQDSLAPPRATDPVFANEPELLNAMHDGLLPLDDRTIPPGWFGSDNVLRWGEHALFPHPHLAPMRELVAALIELAVEGSAKVYIAIDPLRRIPLSNVKPRLLLDQWTGITLTPKILDSLDSKDIQDSFHRAVGRDPSEQRVLPLLGTWFRWRRRDDKGSFDPVRRLYIEEVVAPARGKPAAAGDLICSRALHTERDTAAHAFTHVDGKVCAFDAVAYAPSEQAPMAELGHPNQARKLWRVDGALSDEIWGELVGLFFRYNELIAEHFLLAVDIPNPMSSAPPLPVVRPRNGVA